ncbi:MAG: hypothetical protein ACOCY0_04915 [Roseicyclus sp.]
MTQPTISALPVTPIRTDPPSEFRNEADAFVAALPTFRDEANALAAWVNGVAAAAGAADGFDLEGNAGRVIAVKVTEDGWELVPVATPTQGAKADTALQTYPGLLVVDWGHLTGAGAPDNSGAIKWVRLAAGLTGAGGYNEGLIGSESVTGSAPLVTATAEILVGPMIGQTIHLLETERRFLRTGLSGTLQDDAMQQITGSTGDHDRFSVGTGNGSGAITTRKRFQQNMASNDSATLVSGFDFDSANSPDARTANETRPRNIGVSVYLCLGAV